MTKLQQSSVEGLYRWAPAALSSTQLQILGQMKKDLSCKVGPLGLHGRKSFPSRRLPNPEEGILFWGVFLCYLALCLVILIWTSVFSLCCFHGVSLLLGCSTWTLISCRTFSECRICWSQSGISGLSLPKNSADGGGMATLHCAGNLDEVWTWPLQLPC